LGKYIALALVFLVFVVSVYDYSLVTGSGKINFAGIKAAFIFFIQDVENITTSLIYGIMNYFEDFLVDNFNNVV
jgi:hypothetical protein